MFRGIKTGVYSELTCALLAHSSGRHELSKSTAWTYRESQGREKERKRRKEKYNIH